FDGCSAQSNRLVPSIRWELMREGMEDYEYLWMVNGGAPQVGVPNAADAIAQSFIASRTLFSKVPTDLDRARQQLAQALGASCLTIGPPSLPNGTMGVPYAQTFTAPGATGPYAFALTAGALPPGRTLLAAGALTGTPTVAGTFGFTVTA